MDNFRDFASELDPAFGSHAADAPEILDDAEERRMQVKAYNYWTSLLNGRDFPSIEDLEPASIADFAKHSVLIDFTSGPASATTAYVGAALRRECDLDPDSDRLSDAPFGSLLSRLPAYHAQIMDSRAPVGFETSFRNQRAEGQAYRGILMPFSSDGDTIDFVYGVFNWNEAEVADEPVAEALHDDVLELADEPAPMPVAGLDHLMGRAGFGGEEQPVYGEQADEVFELAEEIDTPEDVLELSAEADIAPAQDVAVFPQPPVSDQGGDDTGHVPFGGFDEDGEADEHEQPRFVHSDFFAHHEPEPISYGNFDQFRPDLQAPETAVGQEPAAIAPPPLPVATITSVSIGDTPVPIEPVSDEEALSAWHGEDAGGDFGQDEQGEASLDEWLTAARATAEDAKAADGRSRQALYRALAEAYDFACAAVSAPAEYDRLLERSGISVQARAPMTAVAKLVFGVDYDKARLTEYAAALSFGARQGVESGEFLPFIEAMEGGLKAMVEAERRERRPASQPAANGRDRAVARLRTAEAQPLDRLAGNGEFALVLVRRGADGSVSPVAAVADEALLERAIKKAAH